MKASTLIGIAAIVVATIPTVVSVATVMNSVETAIPVPPPPGWNSQPFNPDPGPGMWVQANVNVEDGMDGSGPYMYGPPRWVRHSGRQSSIPGNIYGSY